MTQSEQILLSLIRQSLWGDQIVDWTDADREKVYEEACAQAVSGLLPPLSVDEEIQRNVLFIQYTEAETDLFELFQKEQIPLVILKGCAAAVYYPEPYRRSMGDYDFIVPTVFFDKARKLLEDNGYVPHNVPEVIEREIQFDKDGQEYELHYRFSDPDLDIEKYITDGMNQIEFGRIDDHQFPMLPPLANGMVFLAHMRHHLQMGLGLRQIIDWMMYCDKVLDDGFWDNEFQAAAEETGLKTLAVTVTYMCQKYLGLKQTITWCKDAEEELCDVLIDSLLTSGNFGKKQGVGYNVEKTVTSFKKQGVFRYLQLAGENNWEAYHKHPSLKPFCWVYQVFRYTKQGFRRKGQLKSDMDRGRKRYEMMRKLGID
ncbi:MAG: nucleotidyltransferase family protein [Ruminococcus sp.]|nr:nucleotidyltransferase family protein [Ruminococcus sp.]